MNEDKPGYEFEPIPEIARLKRLLLSDQVIEEFLSNHALIDERELRLRPYKRFMLAGSLNQLCGGRLAEKLAGLVRDRSAAGILADFSSQISDPIDCLKLATALTHLIGCPKMDPAGKTYFAWLEIAGSENPNSYQVAPDAALVLHTDGVYEEGETDWIFFMKSREENASGGLSRLLHLDEWPQLERFLAHPLAFHPITFRSEVYDLPPVEKSFFYRQDGEIRIRMNDQEAQPRNLAESVFINDLLLSLQNSDACRTLQLPVGSALLLNNSVWLHGRDPFDPNPALRRQVIRQRGHFADTMNSG